MMDTACLVVIFSSVSDCSKNIGIKMDPSIAPFPLLASLPAGNTKGRSITVPSTSCLTGLELAV